MTAYDDLNVALRAAAVAGGTIERARVAAEESIAQYAAARDEARAQVVTLTAHASELERENGELTVRVAELEARIAELGGQTGEPDPPIIVDPPAPPTTGDPDFSEFPFASRIPRWRHYDRPTEGDCDWVVDGAARLATSRRGLPSVAFSASGDVAGEVFKRSVNAGHPWPTIGVKGYGGVAALGGRDGASGGAAPFDVCRRAQDGSWLPIEVRFVGLSDDAALRVTWGGQQWGRTQRLACFDLGIVGSNSNHGVTQNAPCGEIVFDGFWLIYPDGHPNGSWDAGMHLANVEDRLVLRNMKRRGRLPTDPAAMFRRHALYLKSSSRAGSETWVLGCNLRGGNQTGVQRRPGRDETYLERPADTLVLADNVCDSHGYDHTASDGGSAFTVDAGPLTFVLRNRARNSRYMSLMIGAQPFYTDTQGRVWDRNWYDGEGFALGDTYVDGNDFGNVGSPRHCVSISNARRVFYGDKNRVEGKLVFDSAMSHRTPAPPNGRVMLVGDRARFPVPVLGSSQDAEAPATTAQQAAMHVPTWAEALAP